MIDVAADGQLAANAVKERLRAIAVERRAVIDRLQRSDEEATQRVDVALAYLDLLSNPHAFYLAADERLKRMVVDAMWPSFHIDDEEGGVVAPGELHEPVARLERAAAEYKADKLKSASQSADALDESPSDLYLQVVCSNSAVVVGPVGLEPTTRGLKVRCSTD